MSLEFLKDLYAPAKIKVSHNIISKLLAIDEKAIQKHNLTADLSIFRDDLLISLENFVTAEEKFLIARTEYEKKEQRLISLTSYTENKLDIQYTSKNFQFVDINSNLIAERIESLDIGGLIDTLREEKKVIDRDIELCYTRMEFLLELWEDKGKELYEKLQNLLLRGMKHVSNNLRVRLLPEIKEYKKQCSHPMNEEAPSLMEIELKIQEMVDRARDDIYGELSNSQIEMLNQLKPNMSAKELVEIIDDEKQRKDLVYLLGSGKISITLDKIIERLI